MASFKQKRVVAAYARTFAAQTDFVTALLIALFTNTLPLSRDNRPLPNVRKTREETRECRGRWLIGRRVTSKLALWTLRFDATAEIVAGLLAMAQGEAAAPTGTAPSVHEITHGASDDVPKTSFIIGSDDPDDDEPIELYKGMCVNRIVIEGEVRGKVTVAVEFCGSADIEVIDPEDFTFPACANIVPVYANDCQLLINAIDRTPDLRRFSYTFNNNLAINDDPFPFDSVDAARIERGEQSEDSIFNFTLYGSKAHAVYVAAESELTQAVSLRIGTADESARIIAAGAQLALQDTPIGYAGEANRSVINFDAVPFSLSGNAPDRVSARLALEDRFLVAPA